MVMRFCSALLLSAFFVVSACNNTETPLLHENPLDRIFDSGNFRLVLTGEAKSSTSTTLTWANVYHATEKELSDSKLKLNPSASVLFSAAAPSAADIATVKLGTALGGYTTISSCTIGASSNSYAGSCDVASPNNKGYYIILFNYKFTDKSDIVTTGIIYSNFVAVQ